MSTTALLMNGAMTTAKSGLFDQIRKIVVIPLQSASNRWMASTEVISASVQNPHQLLRMKSTERIGVCTAPNTSAHQAVSRADGLWTSARPVGRPLAADEDDRELLPSLASYSVSSK